MEFEVMDPEAALRHMKTDPALFSDAVATLVGCENFDNRRPRGLDSFLAFFNVHRKAIHAGTLTGADLHEEFRGWLENRR